MIRVILNFKKHFLLATIFFSLSLIVKAQNNGPELIFQSGFEGTTHIIPDLTSDDHGAHIELLVGKDNSLSKKSNWDTDWKKTLKSGVMEIQYTGGDSTKRYAKVIPEPGNPRNHVLKFWLNDSWIADDSYDKARIQANIYGIKDGFKEFYQSVRVFLTEDFNALKNYPPAFTWLTLSEFWNNEWWSLESKNGFRVSLSIAKFQEGNGELYFNLDSEQHGMKPVWTGRDSRVKVPIGKWFTMDYYFKEGDDKTGRFYLTITPEGGKKQVVFDIHNFTHNTHDLAPDGLTDYNPMKIYTSRELIAYMKSQGKTLQIYWDDFKLWNNIGPKSFNISK